MSDETFDRVDLTGARFRMADLSGAVMRSVALRGASIDTELAELDGLTVNGIEVAPLVEAELLRRDPTRALVKAATDPAGLRAAWAALERDWAATYERVAGLPAGAVDVSVEDEWTFVQTLRHLVFATDAWLGAVQGTERPFHPWGVPFSDMSEFIGRTPEDIGLDPGATPPYAEVLELRAAQATRVRDALADVTTERLAETCEGPLWDRNEPISVLRCLRVVLNEECEHRRFAERDLGL